MEPHEPTASAIIDYAEKLEEASTDFYEGLAGRFPQQRELFLSFAEESRKNRTLILRTYRETISDALEACFSFKGVDLKNYAANTELADGVGLEDSLRQAVQLEEKAARFFSETAECSKSLLATIHSAFRKVAERREKQLVRLRSLLKTE